MVGRSVPPPIQIDRQSGAELIAALAWLNEAETAMA